MHNVYCVSYDLKRPEEEYDDLFATLKASKKWWHYLYSTWLIVADETVEELWSKLSSHVSKGDRLLIVGVSGESQGLLPVKAWEWIAQNIDSAESASK